MINSIQIKFKMNSLTVTVHVETYRDIDHSAITTYGVSVTFMVIPELSLEFSGNTKKMLC